jgi:hypothetical protein
MRPAHRLLCLLPALLLAACGEPPPEPVTPPAAAAEPGGDPPQARRDMLEMLRESQTLPYHPSDGGGRAWLEEVRPEHPTISSPARFDIVFETGPEGIAKGGAVYLQVSPFWGWSTPQAVNPDAPGYTEVTTEADGVVLDAETLDQQLLGIRVNGRGLEPGEQLHIAYGAGSAGARTDRYAEAFSRFWIAVDGDGDGVRKVLADSPGTRIYAGAPARLLVLLPTVARPGQSVRVSIALLDASASRGVEFEGDVELEGGAPVLELPARVTLSAADAGVTSVEGRVLEPGIARVRAHAEGGLEAESNPLVATREGPRVLWADLHGHTSWSDGTGTPEDYFAYARDVARLDVASLTDHDHWGMLPLDVDPERWQAIQDTAKRFHEPGRFVTILGYEWTNWIHGHRHVLYFGDEGNIYSSIDPDYESPLQLWAALEGQPALTIAHHSAGGPIAVNWEIPPDPRFEPVTEVVSVHGSSEAMDSPGLIYNPVPGNFVRDALNRGYHLGLIGSGDSHDGHPGLAHLGAPSGGLAAILSEELTRKGVLAALRERRVYATNGARILLRMALGAHRMGSTAQVGADGTLSEELFVRAVGTGPIERVELVRSGEVVDGVDTQGLLDVALQRPVKDLRPGEYLYVRVVQENGGAAWSSPIFIE